MIGGTLLISGVYLRTETNNSRPQGLPQQDAAPKTSRPSNNDIDNYKVAADLPRIITVSKLNIKARILGVGVDKQNRIASPTNVYDVGWFNQSSKPGRPGVMVMDGHVSSESTPGVFYNLKDLSSGDKISVEQGNGNLLNFLVKESVTYDHDKVDMLKVLRPITPNKHGLNLITCSGKVIKGTNEFDKRVVVYAVQQ